MQLCYNPRNKKKKLLTSWIFSVFFGESLSLFFPSKPTLPHEVRNGIFIVWIFGLDIGSIVFFNFYDYL